MVLNRLGLGDMQISEGNPERKGDVIDRMREHLKPVIDEDKFAAGEIDKMLSIVNENPEEPLIKSDRNAVEGRRMPQVMMDAERTEVESVA